MIVAEFFRKNGEITGFKVSGHAEYDESGRDIVCAGVSSAVMMTANLITEIFRFEAEVSAVDDTVTLKLIFRVMMFCRAFIRVLLCRLNRYHWNLTERLK